MSTDELIAGYAVLMPLMTLVGVVVGYAMGVGGKDS
jgi:hypothetical protein